MKTIPLYYEDNGLFDFKADLLDINESRDSLVLSATAFYPGGGGQPCDLGSLSGIPVTAVNKKEEEIVHTLSKPLPEGVSSVEGLVDGQRRRDFMQQHTGQHLLSGCLFRLLGRETVSVHLGEGHSSIEVKQDRLLTEKDRAFLEDRANDLICDNREIKTFTVDEAEIGGYKLRRLPKVSGRIRLVEIEGADLVACGGVHCGRTGEVKLIKIIGQEVVRGHLRILFSIGDRARRDYRMKHDICRRLAEDLSSPVEEIHEKWIARQVEFRETKAQLLEWKFREAALFADSLESVEEGGGRAVVHHWEEGDPEYMKLVVKALLEKEEAFCLTMGNRGKLQWAIGRSGNTLPFNENRTALLETIEGKGGGKAPLWQGVGQNPSGLEDFQKLFRLLCL